MLEEHYREAAAILVLRPSVEEGGLELLLLHKPRKSDAWQLPQGGVEAGESAEQCAVRELSEEAGLKNATVIGTSDRVYSYDFPASFRRFRPDAVKGQRIAFVYALVSRDAIVSVDDVEVNDHVWIPITALSKYITRREYRAMVEALYTEAASLVHHAS